MDTLERNFGTGDTVEDRGENPKRLFWLDKDKKYQFTLSTLERKSEWHEDPGWDRIQLAIKDNNGKEILNLAQLLDHTANNPKVEFYFNKASYRNRTNNLSRGYRAGAHGGFAMFTEDSFLSPKDVFIALHELGHLNVSNRDPQKAKQHDRAVGFMDPAFDKLYSRVPEAEEVLRGERDAWADAIRKAREIKKRYGIDLFANFKNVQGFIDYVDRVGLSPYEQQLDRENFKVFKKKLISYVLDMIKSILPDSSRE